MNHFGKMLEAEIPRLRRYARALTRDTVQADDLVQSCLTRAVAKQHLWAGRHGPTGVAFYDPAQPACQRGASLDPSGHRGRR